MNKIIGKLYSFVKSIINEFLILLGLSLIVTATYLINIIAAIYLLGVVLILFGLFLAKTRRE